MRKQDTLPHWTDARDTVSSVLAACTLEARRLQGRAPTPWPDEGSRDQALAPFTEAQLLDAVADGLLARTLPQDAADIDLFLEAVRAERLSTLLETYRKALLDRLNGSPQEQARRRAIATSRYGQDWLSALRAGAVGEGELQRLLPWAPTPEAQ